MDFIKVGAACPKTRVADIVYNIDNICHCIEDAKNKNIKFLVFPELCVTSYTCGDLFLNSSLINASNPKPSIVVTIFLAFDIFLKLPTITL